MKNPMTAAILGGLCGPFGLFYVSAKWALGSLAVLMILSVLTHGWSFPLVFGCAFIGYWQANEWNRAHGFAAGAPGASASQPPAAAPSYGPAPVAQVQPPAAPSPGSGQAAMKYCAGCGNQLSVSARFCTRCGTAAAA